MARTPSASPGVFRGFFHATEDTLILDEQSGIPVCQNCGLRLLIGSDVTITGMEMVMTHTYIDDCVGDI